jgi:hypothetical protein
VEHVVANHLGKPRKQLLARGELAQLTQCSSAARTFVFCSFQSNAEKRRAMIE